MKKILIVDNEPDFMAELVGALQGSYQVLEATSGDEAIALAEAQNPDLILLNIEIQNNGLNVCLELKNRISTRNISLILLSSHYHREDLLGGLHAGADDYMIKPFCFDELRTRIDNHLQTRGYYNDLSKSDLLMLLELTETVSVTRNPLKILHTIVEKMNKVIDVSRCSIISLSGVGELTVKASSDLPEGNEIKLDLRKYPEIREALETKRPIIVHDIKNNPLMQTVWEEVRGLSDNSVFVVPIIKKESVIGTFLLRTASPFKGGVTERIYKLCQVIANISGNALENAILFETMKTAKEYLENVAIRDGLTQLYNHQHFYTRLEQEFSRAKRHKHELSCLFLDVDDFKKLNDNFGHVIGDVVLRKIGSLIKHVLRESDVAARYGGEEFAILLPDTDHDGALDLAERLLEIIRSQSFDELGGARVTASVGISTYSRDSERQSPGELVQLADDAMYLAKMRGKDRVAISS
ncbi:MAG: diguanylate cyclase [Desulfuromonadales bacterium]